MLFILSSIFSFFSQPKARPTPSLAMDREQEEMQFLGLVDIYVDSYKVIFKWKKIFSQITVALILPLAFIFLAHVEVSNLLFDDIIRNEGELDQTRANSPKYEKLSDMVSTEWTYLLLFKIGYFTVYLILSLLSTAAVVYTIACVYTSREVTFRKVMSVVPKVWMRLMVTFLCIFAFAFAYNIVSLVVIISWAFLVGPTNVGIVVFYVLLGTYIVGFVYMSIVWQLASVVSVLEDACGVKAMDKSRALIRGKMWLATLIFFLLTLSYGAINVTFQRLVVQGDSLGMLNRICYGIICLLLLSKFFLFGFVIQTVVYLVCKSYHHENIDKSALSDHLEVYLGEYVPLKSKDVQLEHYGV